MTKKSTNLLVLTKNKNLFIVKEIKRLAPEYFDRYLVAGYNEIKFRYEGDKFEILVDNKPLDSFTHIISRTSDRFYMIRYLLALEAQRLNIRMLNREAIISMPYYNKVSQMVLLGNKGISMPESQYLTKSNLLELKPKTKYIQKRIDSRLSKSFTLFKRKPKELRRFIIQKAIMSNKDYRIIVLGGKAIGALERDAKLHNKRMNSRNYVLKGRDPKIKIALRVAKALRMEYVGIDLMEYRGKIFVLEANLDAGIKTFKAKTGIDVAELLLKQVKYE